MLKVLLCSYTHHHHVLSQQDYLTQPTTHYRIIDIVNIMGFNTFWVFAYVQVIRTEETNKMWTAKMKHYISETKN